MADRLKKRQRDKPFTDIDNGVFKDKRISLKARGLLCTALSLPENWEFSLRGLRSICKENLTAIQSALDELEKFGYLTRERQQTRGDNGHFAGMDYIFTDAPEGGGTCTQNVDRACTQNVDGTCTQNVDRTCTQNPYTENPYTENVYEKRKEQEINKQDIPPISPQGDKPAFAHEHEAYRCAAYLDGEICKRLPKKRPADEAALQSWAADFDKCFRLDGYDWRTIMEALIFSQRDDFWAACILSGRKFRQKLLQLLAKMQRSGGGAGAAGGVKYIQDSDRYIPEAKAGW